MASPPPRLPNWGNIRAHAFIYIYTGIRYLARCFFLFRSRREYLSVTVSNLDWFVCNARTRPLYVLSWVGTHTPRVKNRDLAAPFSPSSSSSIRPLYYFLSTLRAYVSRRVYYLIRTRAHVIIIRLARVYGTNARGFRSKNILHNS